jgi:hypothetical protein
MTKVSGSEGPRVQKCKRERLGRWSRGGATTSVIALALLCLGTLSVVAGPPASSASASTPLSTTTSPAGGRTIVGAASVAPKGATNLGTAPASKPLDLDVVLQPRDPTALSQFVAAVSAPSSPQYRHYLSKGQFGPMFGASAATITAVSAQLKAEGLTVGPVSSDDLLLPVTTTVSKAESAFSIAIRSFRLASGEKVDANTTAPSVPSSVAPDIASVVGLDGLVQAVPANAGSPAPGQAPTPNVEADAGEAANVTATIGTYSVPCTNESSLHAWSESELAQAYDIDPLYAEGDLGKGESIDLFENSTYSTSDVKAFEKCVGSTVPVVPKPINGGTTNDVEEAPLDIDVILGLVPKLSDLYVYMANTDAASTIGEYDAMASADNAKVVSTSWGECEVAEAGLTDPTKAPSGVPAAEEPIFAEMAADGQTIFAATGDTGSAECERFTLGNGATALAVQDPSTQPSVTAVGGTNLNELGRPPTTPPEETGWSGSGGGISTLWRMPVYQQGPGVINTFSSSTQCQGASAPAVPFATSPSGDCREVPDVSANAAGIDDGLFFNGAWTHAGGTSAATPTWAALMSIIDDSSATCQNDPVGLANPALYDLAASTPSDFNDITTGNNDLNGLNGGHYPAGPGYDMVTGLGTPVGANLAQGLCPRNVVTVAVSGSQAYGATTDKLTMTNNAPSGVTVSGTLACSTVNGGTAIGPTLAAGTYTLDSTSCSGLKVSKPTDDVIAYSGVVNGFAVFEDTTTKLTVSHASEPYGAEGLSTFSATVTTHNGETLPASGPDVNVGIDAASCTFVPTPTPKGGKGSCTLADTALGVGSYSAVSTYTGDTAFDPSTSSKVAYRVTKDTSKIALTLSQPSAPFGKEGASQLSATVTTGQGEETPASDSLVTVTVGGASCSFTPTPGGHGGSGSCTLNPEALAPGTYTATATYGGNANIEKSTSARSTLVVTKDATTTNLSVSTASEPIGSENAATFTVTVTTASGGAMPGTEPVTVSVGSASCVASVAPAVRGGTGSCSLSASALPVGSYTASAAYGGDADLDASGPATAPFLVSSVPTGPTFTLLSGSPNPTSSGSAFNLTAEQCDTGADVQATGTMTFTDVTTDVILGTVALGPSGTGENCGVASIIDVEALPAGSYDIQATYTPSGITPVDTSAPGTFNETVNPA